MKIVTIVKSLIINLSIILFFKKVERVTNYIINFTKVFNFICELNWDSFFIDFAS